MKIAARDVAGLLKAPGSRFSAYLLYGPDQGLVRERARLWLDIFVIHQMTPLPRPT